MVKKKTHGQGEPVHKMHNESSDNKANNSQENNPDTGKSDSATANENGATLTDTIKTAYSESDKVVAEERTAEEKLAEMQDKYIRLSAEFDNYRKRTLREKIELSKYGGENLLMKILPVMDDFERAMAHMDTATDCAAVKNGIDLIFGKFIEFLKQNGVYEIESMNCDFNVDLHDAVAKTPVQEEDKKGKVVDVIQKGYYMQDKVIRHSKVVIGE
jgi:molecular chaperone GrpE